MKGNTLLSLKTIFSKPWIFPFIAVIILLPLLFIGTRTSHDWGDDFAQYIHQAENIVHGIPQSETGYVYNELNPVIGPHAYPMGFPLLLAPVYAIAGNKIEAFITFISLLYIVLGILMIVFYRSYFTRITSLVLAVIFMYNPQMVLFKSEVMSDIPFAIFLVLCFIMHQKLKPGNQKQIILLAIVSGFMLAVKPAGIVFIAAVVVEQIDAWIRHKIKITELATNGGILILIPVLIYYVINLYIYQIPSGGSVDDYLLLFDPVNLLKYFPENFAHYIEVLRYLFIPQSGIFNGLSLLLGSIMTTLILIGFIKRMLQRPTMIDWFFIFYVIMLLVYHYSNSGSRLLVPLGFIFVFYAAVGLKTIQLLPEVAGSKKAAAIGVVVVLLYLPAIRAIASSGYETLEGPQQGSAISTFNYIRKNVPPRAIVVFAKPRALAFYAGCQSIADPFTTNPTSVHVQVMESGASYLLISKKITSVSMKMYARVMQNRITKKWENSEFTLYRINGVNP